MSPVSLARPRRPVGDRLVAVAAGANILVAGLLSLAYGFSHRLFGTADEMAHLDYAYLVWKGRLPVFEDGLTIDPPFGFHEPTQWTAQHPPLFYLAEAPFVGPLLEAHRYVAAGYAGRAVAAVFACAVVAAMMWAARAVAPSRRRLWLAAGTLTAVHPAVVFMGGVAQNDDLALAFTTLLVGISARMLRDGPTTRRLVVFAVVASGALLTRSSGIAVVGVCGAVLGITLLLRRPRQWPMILGLVAAGLAAVASSAWFYLRNLRMTGNLLGAQLDEGLFYLKHRVARPFDVVLLDPNTWWQWHLVWGYEQVDSTTLAWALVGVPLVVAAVLTLLRFRRARRPGEVAIVVMLAVLMAAIVAAQTAYVAHRGGAAWRYLMPLLPATTLAAAWVVTRWRRLTPLLLVGWVLAATLPLAAACAESLVTPEKYSTGPVYPRATVTALFAGGAALAVAVTATLLAPAAGGSGGRPGGCRRLESSATARPSPSAVE